MKKMQIYRIRKKDFNKKVENKVERKVKRKVDNKLKKQKKIFYNFV